MRSAFIPALLTLATALVLSACGGEEAAQSHAAQTAMPQANLSHPPVFADRATELGIAFRHDAALSGELLMPEILGAGVGLVDIDGDGDLDLLLVQSGPGSDESRGSRLYRNLLIETGELGFEDITDASGLHSRCYGTGVASGDIDNDGRVDIYIFCADSNELWHNQGDGRFINIAAQAGADDPAWTGAASFVDIDGDGLLDLYIGNYLDYAPATRRVCRSNAGIADYCGPLTHSPAPDRLLRNLGGGRFEDISARSGIAAGEHGPALGVVAADFNDDGRQDLYIANDAWANHLWINQGGGRFTDEALLAGVAVNSEGQAEASMGVDAGDYNGDGLDDLFMVHLADEKATLYAARSRGQFEDRTLASGLGVLTRGYTGFGAAWIDYDHDGWLDILIVNGRVRRDSSNDTVNDIQAYAQTMLLLRNQGDGRFGDATADAGEAFSQLSVARGAAFGDLNNNGAIDVVVSNIEAAPFVLIHQSPPENWLGIHLREFNRDAQGARAGLKLGDGRVLWRRVRVDGSYASASDPRIVFAVPADQIAVSLEIIWADGTRSSIDASALKQDGYQVIDRPRLDDDA